MAPSMVVLDYGRQGESEVSVSMGKSQRFSRGYNVGFVPDYRFAVENMGESDGAGLCNAVNSDSGGVGSSGRIDTEMTASEDSYAPKRKCMSLNVDRCKGFNVPLQVLSISKMSRSERKDLQGRLNMELEQVRILQRKIALRCFNGVALSPHSDIRSCSDGQRKPTIENIQIGPAGSVNGRDQWRGQRGTGQLYVDSSERQGRKKLPGNRDKTHVKRGPFGRFESVDGPIACKPDVMLMKQCETLLKRLMSHQFGWVFNTAVDPVKLNLPDYFDVIKNPMDLGTIKTRISSGAYSSPLGFSADVRLTFSNAMTYNPPGNDVHFMADALSKFFEVRWKTIEKKIQVTDSRATSSRCIDSIPTRLVGSKGKEASTKPSEVKKRKSSSVNQQVKPESSKRIMTDADKQNLSRDLESLPGDMPEHIIEFLKSHSQNVSQTTEDEIEVDIDALSDDTLFKLRKLLDDYLRQQQPHQAKAEPCEIEVLNESGLSNSSMQPCKGKRKPQLILLDHGLYKALDFPTRTNYAALWKALIFADVKGIKENSVKLGAGEDLYALFAGILTMKPWDRVIDPAVDHLLLQGTDTDRDELQMYASQYFLQISELLKRLPRVILLMLKTNDCLRTIHRSLGSSLDNFLIIGRVSSEAVAETKMLQKKTFFCGLCILLEEILLEARLFGMQIAAWLLQLRRRALSG